MRCSRLALTLFSWPEYVFTTYQRNMRLLLTQEDVLDHVLPDLVVHVEKDADDRAGDEHDDGALDDLVLRRPLDLLQLCPRLVDEAEAAAPRLLHLARRTPLQCRRAGRAAACGGLAGHDASPSPGSAWVRHTTAMTCST